MAKRSAAMPRESMPALGYAELGHATQPTVGVVCELKIDL